MQWSFKKPNKEKEIDELIEKMLLSITKNEHIDLSDQDQFKIVRSILERFKTIKRGKVHDFASQVENLNKLLKELE